MGQGGLNKQLAGRANGDRLVASPPQRICIPGQGGEQVAFVEWKLGHSALGLCRLPE